MSIPISVLLPWPEGLLGPTPASDLFQRLFVRNPKVENLADGWRLTAVLAFADPEGIVLGFPGWDDFGLVLRELSSLEVVLGKDSLIRIMLGAITIRLPRQAFQPVRHTGGLPDVDATGNWIPDNGAPEVTIAWPTNGGQRQHPLQLTISEQGEFQLATSGSGGLPLPAASITPTLVTAAGVVISAQDLMFSFSQENPGLTAGSATIFLPDRVFGGFVPPDFAFREVRLGPNGFTGSVDMSWPLGFDAAHGYFYNIADQPAATLFGINGGLSSFTLTLRENAVQAANILGGLKVPYFEKPVDITLQFDSGGNFSIALTAGAEAGVRLTLEELLALDIHSLAVSQEDNTSALAISGGLEPLLMAADGLTWPRLEVKDLYIDSDGKFRIQEAWLDLKDLATLDLWGFHFELNRLGLGYQEPDDKLWLDLSGSLRLIEQIPVGLGVEGFRLTWPRTLFEQLAITGPPTLDQALAIASRLEVKFDGVYLFYGVPEAVEFEGLIRFFKEAQTVGFAGDMALRVPAAGFAAEAGLMVGMNFAAPPYPFLYVYMGVELPAGIPLGQSGLALKGALGLFGLNVAPDKTPEQNWYYDWFKRGPIVGAHPTNKWVNARDALALGVGVTITTVDGYIKGVRGLLVLAIPGPILIIEGRSLILDGLLPAEPPFRAMAVLDGREKIIQFNVEAEAELIEDMLEAYGMLEAFFDFQDLTNWHLYLGQDEPHDRRIQANVLKLQDAFLFKADAYLMVDMIGARTLRSRLGVFVGFKPPIPDIGPVRITLDAVLEGSGVVTVLPEQFSGQVALSGTVSLEAFGFGLQIGADAGVMSEGPKPFKVDAEVEVRADLPAPLEDIRETFQFSWEEPVIPQITPPLAAVTAASPFAPGGGALQIYERAAVQDQSLWREVAENSPVAPIDTRPVLAFGHELNDAAQISTGSNPQPAFVRHPDGLPKTYDVGLMRFTPTLTKVSLYEHRQGEPWPDSLSGWKLIASSQATDINAGTARLPGVWMAEADPQDPGTPPTRRLHLWTTNPLLHAAVTLGIGYGGPFDLTPSGRQPAGISHAQQLLDLHPDLWQCDDTEPQRRCVDFTGTAGTGLEPGVAWEYQGLRFTALFNPASVDVERPPRPLLSPTNRRQIQKALAAFDSLFKNPQLIITEPQLLSWARSIPSGLRRLIQQSRPDLRTFWDWLWPAAGAQPCLVGQGRLAVRFPEPVRQVWVRFCKLPKITGTDPSAVVDTVRAARSPMELKEILDEAEAKGISPEPGACRYPVAHQVSATRNTWEITTDEGFDCLGLLKKEDFAIAEICYLTAREVAQAERLAAQCRTNNGNEPDPQNVLQPGSYYRLEIESRVAGELADLHDPLSEFYVDILEQLGLVDTEKDYRQVAFFRTEAPPTALAPYVKWSNPPHQAWRVFCRDDFSLRFLRPNLHTMYGHPSHRLEILLRNAAGLLTSGYSTSWSKAGSASLLPEEQLWRRHRSELGLANTPVDADDILIARRLATGLEPHARYDLLVIGGEGGELFFQDDFTELSEKIWQSDRTGWQVQNNILRRLNNSPAHLTAGNPNWTDLDFGVELRLTNNRAGGLLVRASSRPGPGGSPVWNGCRISLIWDPAGSFLLSLDALQRHPTGSGAIVTRNLHLRNFNLPSGLWNHLRVSLVGHRLRLWVFDELLVAGELYQVVRDWTPQDRLPGTLVWFAGGSLDAEHRQAVQRGDLLPATQGQVGLSAAGQGPEFRRLRVRDAVLYRAGFTTSAFAGFRQLVESGRDGLAALANTYVPFVKVITTSGDDLLAAVVQAATEQTAANLPSASWAWHCAHIDYRFEALDRERLEECRLALREARANHDAAFRTLAEVLAPELYYLPYPSHLDLYVLRHDTGDVFGLWLRSPESLDLWQDVPDETGNPADNHVGRTTIGVSQSSNLDIKIFHDADGTQVLILRPNNQVWPGGLYHLTFAYQRNHGDEVGDGDHRYDRPVELRNGTSHIETVQISFTM